MVHGIHVVPPVVVGIVIRVFLTRYDIPTCVPDLWITKVDVSGSTRFHFPSRICVWSPSGMVWATKTTRIGSRGVSTLEVLPRVPVTVSHSESLHMSTVNDAAGMF